LGAIHLDGLSRVRARLGEAVLEPARWPDLMDGICQAVGATGALLLQTDVRTPDVPRTASIDEFIKSYFGNGWHLRDTRARGGVPLLLGGEPVIIDQDVVSLDEMRRDGLYNECMIPAGFKWFAAVGFHAGSAFWGLSIQRTIAEGPFEAEDKRALATLSRRLTETATLSTAVGRAALSGVTGTLNRLSRPAIILNSSGTVLDINAGADRLFNDELRVRRRRLFIKDQKAQSKLEAFLARMSVAPDSAALNVDPIAVRRTEQRPIVIRVLPIDGAASGPFLGARALLLLTELVPRPGPLPGLLINAFGLTPAEARLASLIASGASLDEIPEHLGITRDTARNQLKAVFAKTSTHRQAELVALLSGTML
jgi:DNA-binding CsgD family transcriptional regulator